MERIQLQLVELLSRQTERYTNNESSSVRVEQAQQLLQSITYCIGVYLKSISDMYNKIEVLNNEDVKTMFYKGLDLITLYKKNSKFLLETLQKDFRNINNIAFYDTIFKAIPEFFHDYEMEFSSHDIPCSIDYPLCNEITSLLGIEYIKEYLNHISLEQEFCNNFTEGTINLLLQSYHEDSEELLINIYELVLTNALGCKLADQEVNNLLLQKENIIWLQKKLEQYDLNQLGKLLMKTIEQIGIEYHINSDGMNYAKSAITKIVYRIHQNLRINALDQIFIPVKKEVNKERILLLEGLQMEDKKLRALIEELRDCRYTTDKIAIIRREIHSLNDLMELLEVCFFEEEYHEVFQALSDTELSILKETIQKNMIQESIDGIHSLKTWQEKLISYSRLK